MDMLKQVSISFYFEVSKKFYSSNEINTKTLLKSKTFSSGSYDLLMSEIKPHNKLCGRSFSGLISEHKKILDFLCRKLSIIFLHPKTKKILMDFWVQKISKFSWKQGALQTPTFKCSKL